MKQTIQDSTSRTAEQASLTTGGDDPTSLALRTILDGIPSVFRRLVYLSSALNCTTGSDFGLTVSCAKERFPELLRQAHEQVFTQWLLQPLRQQQADLELHFETLKEQPIPQATGSLLTLVPATATDADRRLYCCDLDVALALLRCHATPSITDWRVRQLLEHAVHVCGSLQLGLKDLAAGFRVSERRVRVLFRRHTGLAWKVFSRNLRVIRAVELFREPSLSLKGIAAALGYSDPSNLGREFRAFIGIPPGELRDRILQACARLRDAQGSGGSRASVSLSAQNSNV